MKISNEMEAYFTELNNTVKDTHAVATEARKKGYDPAEKVEIGLAKNMAERVIGLIAVVAPQIAESKAAERITELEKEYGILDWRVALKIAEEIAQEKLCKFEDKKQAMEAGIRTGFAYITLGTVSSPLEGLTEVKFKKRVDDGEDYFALQYAGPVRSAGGTGAAVSVLIADYIRKKMGYPAYDPTEEEIKRAVTEVYDYHDRVTNLQYLPSEEEVDFLFRNLPVQIDGDPTEEVEVSNYKDLQRINTNNVRNGFCLVMGECLAQKAPKLWKQLSKWGKDFDLEHWNFLKKFLEIQKKVKAKGKIKEAGKKAKISPVYTYISDLVAGRPVFAHPLAKGAFRLRYGRSRTSGFSAQSIHPATMHVLNSFIAVATQLKVERPGKAAAYTPVDTIEGPIVKLTDGSVVMVENENHAKRIKKHIKEVLFLGDVLVNYGDFLDRAHPLVPSGYCEEWWIQEVEKATVNVFGNLDYEKLSEILEVTAEDLDVLFKEPCKTKISMNAGLLISEKLKVPLHPYYTYHWSDISVEELENLIEWIAKGKVEKSNNEIIKIIIPIEKDNKRTLEKLGVPHAVASNEYVVIEKNHSKSIIVSIGLEKKELNEVKSIIDQNKGKEPLEIINLLSNIKIRDKSGTYIGGRMGRPEKAKLRKLTGSPQVLFPVGDEGGRLRCFQSALEAGKITAEFPIYKCEKCDKETVLSKCETCDSKTKKLYLCNICGAMETEECDKHGKNKTYNRRDIDINHYFRSLLKKLKTKTFPDLIKGVRGTSNKDHIPEHLIKGVLRAKHTLYVNKDGTVRYDCSEIPVTHFKPKEIQVSVKKLIELGYTRDIKGRPLVNEEQVLEIKPQDLILPCCPDSPDEACDEVMFRVANFIDEMLVKFYGMKPFYNLRAKADLVGHLAIGLAPHTSAGTVLRIIGFSKTQGFLSHPLVHAAMRRDCLGYDNYVSINENGNWQIKKIGEFVDEINPDKKADVYGTLKKDVSDISVWSNPRESKVKEVTKHKPNKLLRLYLECGRKIDLTEDHKVYTKGKKERRANELKLNDKLMINYKKDIKDKDIKEIFLPEMFQDRDDVMLRNIKLFLDNFGKLSKYTNFYRRDSFPIKFVNSFLKKHNKSLYDLPSQTKIGIKRDNISIPIRIPLNKELLEVIGLYIAEGHSRKNNSKKGFYQVSIASADENIKKLIKKVFYKYFELKPNETHPEQLTFSSRIIYELFKNYLKIGMNARGKRIPNMFLNLKKEKLAALLRGYFEGDGSVSLSDIRITCDTVSEGLKHDLSFILSRWGIFTKFYRQKKGPGPTVKEFYLKKGREIPMFEITKIVIPSDFVAKFKDIGFISKRKNNILNQICKRTPYGMRIDYDDNYVYPKVTKIENLGEKESYCFSVSNEHNFFANDVLVHNCDGDEAAIMMLMDAFLNFSRSYLPSHRGSTQDVCLVATSKLNPREVDDMIFNVDVVWKYPLELYEAALEYKMPWDIKVKVVENVLGTPDEYENMGFTHDTDNINGGVLVSAYKTLPSMEEKLKSQMDIAEKIRAVDEVDVARLVIEKHFIRDTKGNLRKFSQQKFRCVACNEKFRRPPLVGKCTKCNGKIIFTISEGSIVKYLEPSMSLANKYDVPAFLKQNLELTKRRFEGVFGREKEKQEGLGKWFG